MADLLDMNKLLLFIVFIIPGFISIKVYSLLVPSIEKDSSKLVIDAITYSCINYASFSWAILLMEYYLNYSDHPIWNSFFYLILLFITPVLLPWILVNIRKRDFIQKNMPHPTKTPWDFVFAQRDSYWAIITLKNGKKFAGKYSTSSFTSSYPEKEQIYLEESWIMNSDGGFDRSRINSKGIIILSEIESIELFVYNSEEKDIENV